jgi:hypothetical protein
MWRRLRRVIGVRQVSAGAAGLMLGLLLNLGSDWLAGPGLVLVPLIVAIFILAFLVSAWLWWRNPDRVGIHLQYVKTLRTETERAQHGRRGLIAFVSLYRPDRASPAAQLQPEDWQRAARDLDYEALDLPRSNLATTIEAITAHASHLEHCWLIGTTATDSQTPGSDVYIPSLVEYLRREYDVHCEFHYSPDLAISLDDDALVFDKTIDMLRGIFRQAVDLKLSDSDIVADFTGGIRSMTLGMILACLDGDRDIEMIGTHYGPDGRWAGPRFPIIFGFEPVLYQN